MTTRQAAFRNETLKGIARGAARLLVFPMYLSLQVRSAAFGDEAFVTSSQALSLIPGRFGDYLRREFYRLTLRECAVDCQITFGTLFSSRAAKVGRHAYIGPHCDIGDAEIGPDVLLGSNVHLLGGKAQHGIRDLTVPIRLQERRSSTIVIGEDTWIGNSSIVMADVGKKCVVGAGSVVVANIPDYSVAVGNPARVVRRRDTAAAQRRMP